MPCNRTAPPQRATGPRWQPCTCSIELNVAAALIVTLAAWLSGAAVLSRATSGNMSKPPNGTNRFDRIILLTSQLVC